MAFETQQALKKLQRKYGDVDEFVRKRLSIYATKEEMWQVLAAEQVDGVALAIDNIESGQGFIIGDQTGIGKGRQAAAIILYCKMNGYNCVFVTKTADLLSDMYRDFKDIKADFIVPYVFNETDLIDPEVKLTEKEIEKGTGKNLLWVLKDDIRYKKKNNKDHNDNLDGQRKLPEGYDFVMTTYSQLTEDKVAKEAAKKAEYGENKWQEHYSFTENSQARCEFLRQYAKGSIIVMDEAHLASGKFSTTGFFFKEAVTNSHSTIFLSATYAKRPENMPIYALKTALSEANITEDEFETVFEIGDVPLQELVAAELTRNGQMIRRQRPFNGIDVNYKILNDIETSDRHIRYYDKVMEVIRAVMAFEKNFVSEEQQVVMQQIGFKGEVNDNQTIQTTGSDLFSKIHSIARQLLFALKAGDVADLALELLRQNKKVVIAFSSTNETFLKEMNLSAGDVVSDFSFSTILQRLLNKTLNFSAKREDGVIENFKIDPFNVGTEFENTFENLSREIYDLGQELGLMSVSPIDDIINKIQSAARPNDKIGGIASANYRVRECTGRSAQIKVEKGQPIYYSFKSNKKQFFKDFNSGNADVLLINSAASTGVSCHAYYKFADTRQRSMIIHQPELDINEEIQKRGKINRTGQEMVSGLPYFDKKGNVATVHVQEETPTDTNGYWINLGNNKKVSVFDDKSSVWKVHPTAQSNLPEYWYVSTVIPTEERALKMLKKKLKSLDSLTTGNQKANDDQLDTEDFFNKYGDKVVRDFMKSKKNQKAYERLYIKSLISNAKMSPAEKEGIVVDWNRHIPEDRKQAAVFIKENVLLALANVVREKGIKSDKKRKYDDKITTKDDVDYALGRIVKYSDNLGEIFTAVQVGKMIPNVANIQDKFVNVPLFSENFFDYVNKLPFGEEIYISSKMLLQKRPSGYVLIIPNNYSKVFGDKTISLLLLNVTGGSHWGARWKVGTAKTLEGYISSETFTKFIKKLYDKTKVYVKIEGSLEPKTKMLTPLGKKGRYYYETEKYFPDAMPEQYRIKVDGAKGKPAILTYEYPLPPKGRYQFDLKPFYKTIEDLYIAWESGLSETQKQYAKGSFVKEISGLDKQVQINRIALFIEQNAHEEGQPIYVFGTKFNARDLANMFYKKYINSAADTRFTRLKKLTEIVKYWHQANEKRA
jgi:transposase-like protein